MTKKEFWIEWLGAWFVAICLITLFLGLAVWVGWWSLIAVGLFGILGVGYLKSQDFDG